MKSFSFALAQKPQDLSRAVHIRWGELGVGKDEIHQGPTVINGVNVLAEPLPLVPRKTESGVRKVARNNGHTGRLKELSDGLFLACGAYEAVDFRIGCFQEF